MAKKKAAAIRNKHAELTRRIAQLEARGGGTLELGDGVYGINRPLRLPRVVSLCMSPHAIIRALPAFKGDAVVIKEGTEAGVHMAGGCIRGGVIDAGRQPLTGLRVDKVSRMEIGELEVRDATYKGIHIVNASGPGKATFYEVNLSNVRCNVDVYTRYAPASIGIHIESGDNLVRSAVVIGYEIGVRSDGASNDFHLVHVWNSDPNQGPMKYCFYCNGHADTYSQCYADSPTVAGFYMTRPFNRVSCCRIYYSRWAPDNAGAGVLIEPNGMNSTFVGNYFLADDKHKLAKAYDGHLETACILGESYNGWVINGGMECRIPSGGSGDHPQPPLYLAGRGFRLAPQAHPPEAQHGQLGEVRWVDGGATAALYVKTSQGWKRALLER